MGIIAIYGDTVSDAYLRLLVIQFGILLSTIRSSRSISSLTRSVGSSIPVDHGDDLNSASWPGLGFPTRAEKTGTAGAESGSHHSLRIAFDRDGYRSVCSKCPPELPSRCFECLSATDLSSPRLTRESLAHPRWGAISASIESVAVAFRNETRSGSDRQSLRSEIGAEAKRTETTAVTRFGPMVSTQRRLCHDLSDSDSDPRFGTSTLVGTLSLPDSNRRIGLLQVSTLGCHWNETALFYRSVARLGADRC